MFTRLALIAAFSMTLLACGGPEGDELRVYRGESSDFEALLVVRANADELALTWVSPKADVPYQLRRS